MDGPARDLNDSSPSGREDAYVKCSSGVKCILAQRWRRSAAVRGGQGRRLRKQMGCKVGSGELDACGGQEEGEARDGSRWEKERERSACVRVAHRCRSRLFYRVAQHRTERDEERKEAGTGERGSGEGEKGDARAHIHTRTKEEEGTMRGAIRDQWKKMRHTESR